MERKTVQCLSPVNQIGALKFVTPGWPTVATPEMSRMTAFISLSLRCSLTDLQLYIHEHETAKCKTVATSTLGNTYFKTRWFCGWWRVETLHNHTLTSLCFFLFWTMDHRKRLVPIAATIDGPSALYLANAQKWSFHSNFRRTVTKILCSALGSPSLFGKKHRLCFVKERQLSKTTQGRSRSSQKKMPGDRGKFQKELQDIVETKISHSAQRFGVKLYKSAGNKKTLRNELNR